MNIKTNCKEFLGCIPWKPNKNFGVHCFDATGQICKYYKKINKRILIIKLGVAGDVIRTTPILRALRIKYNNSFIAWLTHFPELVPSIHDNENGVDKIYKWETQAFCFLQNISFDIVINLDKDEYACGFAKGFENNSKFFGYTIKNNIPYPANKLAEHKYLTGIFDDISINNKKNYIEEIFEICGLNYDSEEYILPEYNKVDIFDIDNSKKIVGLNTGCGGRWTSRLWPEKYWIELAQKLLERNYEVILLGGPEENEKNKRISETTGAKYFGTYPLNSFIGLMDKCEIIVTAVTMAMHIAIGLKKKLVLMNNIFNRNEFELYNRGIILEPEKKCTCYFNPSCTNGEYKCIEYIFVDNVLNTIQNV